MGLEGELRGGSIRGNRAETTWKKTGGEKEW